MIQEQHTEALLDYKDAVILFMGAGDVQKFQAAYENILDMSVIEEKRAVN